jgi:hypothetical protein
MALALANHQAGRDPIGTERWQAYGNKQASR